MKGQQKGDPPSKTAGRQRPLKKKTMEESFECDNKEIQEIKKEEIKS